MKFLNNGVEEDIVTSTINRGKMNSAFSQNLTYENYGFTVVLYMVVIFLELILSKFGEKIGKIVGVIRKMISSYGFFEIFMNIILDLSLTKKIMFRGNWSIRVVPLLTFLIPVYEICQLVKEIEKNLGLAKIQKKNEGRVENEKEEENSKQIIPLKNKKMHEVKMIPKKSKRISISEPMINRKGLKQEPQKDKDKSKPQKLKVNIRRSKLGEKTRKVKNQNRKGKFSKMMMNRNQSRRKKIEPLKKNEDKKISNSKELFHRNLG